MKKMLAHKDWLVKRFNKLLIQGYQQIAKNHPLGQAWSHQGWS